MEDKVNVFIVNNNIFSVYNLKKMIEKNSRVDKIWFSNDGRDSIPEIMKTEPDIAFLDMEMPKKNGLQIMEALYWYPCMKKNPKFVLITERTDESLYEEAREMGFDFEIVHKPFDMERIHKCIDSFVLTEIDEEEEERKRQEDNEILREELKKWRMAQSQTNNE